MAGESRNGDRPGRTPEELQEKIEKLKGASRQGSGFARAMGLVVSLGCTFAAVLVAALFLGQALDEKYGTGMWTPVALVVGVLAGGWASWMLVRPFLEEGSK